MIEKPSFSRPVEVSTIGSAGTVERIEASDAERAALADSLGLVAIRSLVADISLSRSNRAAIEVEGSLKADIVQTCVVSLVELDQRIEETFSLRFIERATADTAESRHEIRVDPQDADPPEMLSGPILDLGPIVIEQLALAIDPYPRAPGAKLPDNPAAATEDPNESPFAVLVKIKRSQGR